MTSITIPRALLERALETLGNIPHPPWRNLSLTEALRAELAKPVEPADPLDWPIPCDIKIGGGTHSKGTSLRSLVLRMKALHEAAFPGQASITKEQQDANLERLMNPPTPTPAWHDAPTEPGLWFNSINHYAELVSQHWIDRGLVANSHARWYGPIQPDGEKS